MFVICLDYMMKLRGKMFEAGTNDFHTVMTVGTSVHVTALRRRIVSVDELTAGEIKAEFQVGDYRISHLDTYAYNNVHVY